MAQLLVGDSKSTFFVLLFYGEAWSFVGDFPTKCVSFCVLREHFYVWLSSVTSPADRRFILIKNPPLTSPPAKTDCEKTQK